MMQSHFPTGDLINSLVADLRPLRRRTVALRIAAGTAAGAIVALLGVIALGIRPDLASTMRTGALWSKVAYTSFFAFLSLLAIKQLARPEERANLVWLLPLPFLFFSPLALLEVVNSSSPNWLSLLLGHGWRQCTWLILALSVPVFGGLLWAFKSFAPARPRVAGAVAGLCSSSVAGVAYGLHCPSNTALFVLVWYTLAFAIASIVGALIGDRLLRW
jgi:hypothetical protein